MGIKYFRGARIEVLKGLGLIETFNETREGKRVLYTRLTEKGKEVGEKLVEVESMLSDGF